MLSRRLRCHRRSTKQHHSRRGAASVEAIIALPVLILILASLYLMRDQVVSKQAAEMQARSCAWLFSMKNCRLEDVPESCRNVLQITNKSGNATPELDRAIRGGKDAALRGRDTTGVVETIVGSLLGPALEAAFGRSVDATVKHTVDRPALYGGGTLTVSGSTHLACNLTPETPEDVAKDAWNLFAP